jgi:hypothetical protein
VTWFEWVETAIEAQRVVTAGDDGKSEKPLTREEHLKQALGVPDALLRGDTRPLLVYFHAPHDKTPNGKLSDTLCDKVLGDETAARWGRLFRGVQLDLATSDRKFLDLLEAGTSPSFSVFDADAKLVAKLGAPNTAAKLQKALEGVVATKLPEVARRVRLALEAQDVAMDAAKALMKQDRWKDALVQLDTVRFADVRVGPHFDKAQFDGITVEERIAREAAKAGK